MLAELGINQRLWRGWRLAYRLKEPEKESVAVAVARIRAKIKVSNDCPMEVIVPRTKSDAERRAAAQRLADAKRDRAAAQRAAGLKIS